MDKNETFTAYARLIVVSSIENLAHWTQIVFQGTRAEEKLTMKHIQSWAEGFLKKLEKLNRNETFAKFYDEVQSYKQFTSEILGLSITVDLGSREIFLKHLARWINYLNAKAKGEYHEHPEWYFYGEPSSEIELNNERIIGADKAIPNDGEVCVIKDKKNGYPFVAYYEASKKIFVELKGEMEILYFADKIYKWRSINE